MQECTNFRWRLALIMFAISFISYMDRVNLSVATPAIMQEFGFSKLDMGALQTAFFVGYACMQVPGGMLAERFGCRSVVTVAVAFWSLFTSLTGLCNSFASFAAMRVFFGIGEGPLAPSFGRFIYKWFTVNEKGRGSACFLSGMFIGPVIGPAVTVFLMLQLGWRSVFVLFGLMGLLLAALWWYFVRESPRDRRFVSPTESQYIEGDRETKNTSEQKAPWKDFFTSSQFWAIGIQFFVTDYIMYVFLAWLPLYLMEARGFSLTSMGFAASLPWIALCIVTLSTGVMSDKLVVAGVSKTKSRTIFAAFGLAFCCLSLYLGALAQSPFWNLFWLTLSLGSLGLTFSSSWAACIDIGGEYSGSVSGWMNLWGNLGGAAAPLLTAWIATNYGWQAAILNTAALALVGVVAWLAVKPDMPLCDSRETHSIPVEI